MQSRTAIGQDSHSFENPSSDKHLVLGGIIFEGQPGLKGNSDADVVLHALCNSVSGISGVNILGKKSDEMCRSGITDSSKYLKEALRHLGDWKISHISVSLECLKPAISPRIDDMKKSIADICGISAKQVGITATSGEGLTAFGRGEGIQAFTIVTAEKV